MNDFILRLNGIVPTENNYVNLLNSIASEFAIINDAITKLNNLILINEENPGIEWLKIIDASKTKMTKMMRQVNSLVKNGWLSDPQYHAEVAKLYELIQQNQLLWLYTEAPSQIMSFYNIYREHYIKNVVKPYHKSLIIEAIYAIKDNTPIVDDNICDILSFLNDEKYFTKHQIDAEIYDMV
jgi:hypothetical protein